MLTVSQEVCSMKGDTPPMLMYAVVRTLLFILVLFIVVMALLTSMTMK